MCGTCGCGKADEASLTDMQTGETRAVRGHSHGHGRDHDHGHTHDHGRGHGHRHGHDHHHDHDHDHAHAHDHAHGHGHDHAREHGHHHHDHGPDHHHVHAPAPDASVVTLEAQILAKNDKLAARNRGWLEGREILALNIVAAPGAGKTTLLERTIRDLKDELPISVIEGDQATDNDGARIRAAGAPAVQVNTGAGCHLEADMIAKGLDALKPAPGSVVLIENVGNLVCPALFDLGERAKVVVLSVAEGEDKPLKYPHMFWASDLMILNKIDLLPHVDFDVAAAVANARAVNPRIEVIALSARTGEGLGDWYGWLRRQRAETSISPFTEQSSD